MICPYSRATRGLLNSGFQGCTSHSHPGRLTTVGSTKNVHSVDRDTYNRICSKDKHKKCEFYASKSQKNNERYYCERCDKEVYEDEKYCPSCGERQY